MGIYNADANYQPTTLLLDAGTVSAATTGLKEITISQSLSPGVYWIGVAGQTAGCTLSAYFATAAMGMVSLTAFALNTPSGYQMSSVTGALPGTFTNSTVPIAVPNIRLRVS
jgi:hypothetical protein